MKTYNGLPLYDVVFDEDGLLIERIALVKRPANKRTFAAMSEVEVARFSVIDEDKRIATGLITAVDMPIYRRDKERGEYYVVFSRESVEKMMVDFMRAGNGETAILMHDDKAIADGVFMIESYLKDAERGIAPVGYDDIADGSWFGTYKFDNDEVWQSVKDGTFSGFSIHGKYGIVETVEISEVEQLIAEIDALSLEIDGIVIKN